jgi:hypothetical protein
MCQGFTRIHEIRGGESIYLVVSGGLVAPAALTVMLEIHVKPTFVADIADFGLVLINYTARGKREDDSAACR